LSTQSPQQYPNNPYSPQATLGPPNKPVGTTTSSGGGGWKWLVIILGIGGLGIVACCGVCAGFGYFGLNVIKTQPPYTMAMAKVRESAEVNDKIGQPIEDSISFNDQGMKFNDRGQEGDAHLSINIKGPKGSGVVSVDATKKAGTWTLDECTVTFSDGTTQTLVGGAEKTEAAPAESETEEMKEEELAPTP
jgi:hypothetical protein